jgi:hypothetical protein
MIYLDEYMINDIWEAGLPEKGCWIIPDRLITLYSREEMYTLYIYICHSHSYDPQNLEIKVRLRSGYK